MRYDFRGVQDAGATTTTTEGNDKKLVFHYTEIIIRNHGFSFNYYTVVNLAKLEHCLGIRGFESPKEIL